MSIENMNIEHKNKIEEKENKKDIFTNSEEQFSKLKNEEKISKEFYLNQVKEFESKTGEQWMQILNNLQSFLIKNSVDDVKWQLATIIKSGFKKRESGLFFWKKLFWQKYKKKYNDIEK